MFKRDGTHVCLWPIQADVRQKPTQHCKAIILQLKINKFNFFLSGKKKPHKPKQSSLWISNEILFSP